jgi:hypothetical protein
MSPSVLFPRPPGALVWAGRRLALFFLGFALAAGAAETQTVVFDQPVATREWTLAELNPDLPADWTGYDFLVLEFRASSPQRFELGLKTAQGFISKRIHPFPGVWLRASIPLRFFRQGLGDGVDLAATVNQPRNSYWINIEAGGHGPTTAVQGISVVMRYPSTRATLEIRSVTLAKTDPGDAVLEGKPLIDEFGQYTHSEWPGKAHTEDELKTAWAAESAGLAPAFAAERGPYGGFAGTHAAATGFFRVEKIDGRWWFVTPDGQLFYSVGANAMSPYSGTRTVGREDLFAWIPPPPKLPPGVPLRGGPLTSFYTANLVRRFGPDWPAPWAELTARRLAAWGINTAYSSLLNDSLPDPALRRPYVMSLRDLNLGRAIMGMPDVYADDFAARVEAAAARQLLPRKDDPWLVGYFIGNEPPWPNRESQLVDLFLAGPPSATQQRFKTALLAGDTPARRKQLVLAAFEHYLAVIVAAGKKADPHHLNLGIRFGGTPPDDIIKLAHVFDVYSLNKYRYAVPSELLDKVYVLTGRPLLIGEFHIGVPGRGMAPGLVQAVNQEERGLAYRYYVEHAAAHPAVIGTHWFEWIDEPVSGRPDGENYNIGWLDVTDQPYPELVAAAKLTHARLLDLHSGKSAPTDRMPRASELGTPRDAAKLGMPAIQ